MKFNKKYKTVFLDIKSSDINIDERVNIVLSPSFYWVKKVSLGVKHLRDIKKVLPSIFEDSLPEGNYSYSAYKKRGEFIIFAYEDKFILDTLSNLGISASNVANIYFAQSEFENIEDAFKINEEEALNLKDGLVVVVPLAWVSEYKEPDILYMRHSKHRVFLRQYAHIVDNTNFYKASAVLALLSLLLGIHYFIILKKTEDVLDAKDKIFVKHKLQPTALQNRSILKNYKSIHEKQQDLREYIFQLLSLKMSNNSRLSSLNFKNGVLSADFNTFSKSDIEHIAKELKSKNINFKTSINNKTMHLEINL